MFKFLRSFRKPNINNIMWAINTQVTKLNQLVESNKAEVAANREAMDKLALANNNLNGEAEHALRIAGRLGELVS
jgi:hypothetical protein